MSDKLLYKNNYENFNRIKPLTNVIFNILFICLTVIMLVPVLFILSISFAKESSIQEYGYQLIPRIFSLDGYIFLYNQANMILKALWISVFVTVAGTVIGVFLTTSMGYVLSRPQYRLKKFMTWLVFIPMIFNGGWYPPTI